MPLYDPGGTKCTEQYQIKTLDVIQSIFDKYGGQRPFSILGDFNTQLPQAPSTYATWYRAYGFDKHSTVLSIFMCNNNLATVDLKSSQPVN